MPLSYFGGAGIGIQQHYLSAQLVNARALARTQQLAQQAGGPESGANILAATGTPGSAVTSNNPTTTAQLQKLQTEADAACKLGGAECAAAWMNYGNAVAESLSTSYINPAKPSQLDLYFYPHTQTTTTRYVSPDVAAISISASSSYVR